MKKILVTTDFSEHSKAGLIFAMQLANQNNYHLTFLNVHHPLTPSAWDAVRMDDYEDEQKDMIRTKLLHFVEDVYKSSKIQTVPIEYVVEISVLPNACIIEYAKEHSFDYICISTRGAGKLEKIIGTIAANLINHSATPVIVVPYDYKISDIKSILYASDLDDYTNEILEVVVFAKALNASIELLHFTSKSEENKHREEIEVKIEKLTDYPIHIHIINKDPGVHLVDAIELAVENMQFSPSVLIMFTGRTKNWFERIFYSSNSAQYAFQTKVPLLVFNKS
ncbi:universal stress protein [Chryseobacterium chendengshani]|uniref:universal stress protein n=1 Tax=Chryseobacterium sp. LJ668 TaxID=2864040 RepID=UPI001C6902D8|nr:universal stress protein [Chryseobacterium sp. LJ668]MBW8523760.1 universal stress protein [Chryseobacterium sp. LJ668]QYK16704.1 universal stress protein [Chryseobacterium sp. LJ668]